MKKLNLFLNLLFWASLTIQAQNWVNKKVKGNGAVKTITRNTEDYNSVHVYGSLDVELIEGEEGFIEIEAEENLMEYITTKVVGNELIIKTKKNHYLRPSDRKGIVITVPFKHLNKVEISGSGDIKSTSTIKSDDFSVSVSGSGDVSLHVETETLKAEIAGSGDIKLYGNTENVTIAIEGSGDVSAYEFKSENAKVSISGSGDVKLFVTEQIEASIAGSGDISYRGNPKNIEKSIAGSGTVSQE